MNPEMRIESISFDGEGPYLQMVVSMDRSEDVPAYVERVEHSGDFQAGRTQPVGKERRGQGDRADIRNCLRNSGNGRTG